MPIAVQVVQEDVFAQWVEAKKEGDDDKAKQLLSAAENELKERQVADASAAR